MRYLYLQRLSILAVLCIWFCFGCGKSETPVKQTDKSEYQYHSGETKVLVPDAAGTVTVDSGPLLLDFSHSDQGYFMGKLTVPDTKVNIQVTGPDGVNYKYFLSVSDEWTTFPLTAGSGPYLIMTFEEISDGKYATLTTYPLDVTLENAFLPFLYPNQYVSFNSDCEAIQLAAELSKEAETDLDALNTIYGYITEHITYDDEKAATVQAGYLPDIDETLRTEKGICFDYAALTVSMLRSLSIPSRLVIGYSGEIRHAWIDVYIGSIGWVERAVEFNDDEWKLMDPTLAASNPDSEAVQTYTTNPENYEIQYVR